MIWLVLLVVWIALSALGQIVQNVQRGELTTDDLLGWGWFILLVFLLVQNGVFNRLT
jgi:hypothetical protein